jgi:hypothetical protein
MKIGALRRINRSIAGLMLCLALVAISLVLINHTPAASAASIAPGCTAARPIKIGGTIRGFGGQFNNWSVNAQVSVDLKASGSSQKVDVDGLPTSAGYSYYEYINPTLQPPGAASGYQTTYGDHGTYATKTTTSGTATGPLCVSTKVKSAWFEVYSKDPTRNTEFTYYGGAAEQSIPVKVGMAPFGLRLPTADEYGGNTGDVNGYISYKSKPIPTANLIIRAWPTRPGTDCGVQGFAASGTSGVSTSQNATYYLIKHLAGGQCNADTQTYAIHITCKAPYCGPVDIPQVKNVSVKDGSKPRLDFKF